MPRRSRDTLLVLACLCVAGAPGCKRGKSGRGEAAKDAGIKRTALRGPVRLIVQTDRSTATIAERFHVTVTVEADDGIDVTMPQFGESLGAFSIRDFRQWGHDLRQPVRRVGCFVGRLESFGYLLPSVSDGP